MRAFPDIHVGLFKFVLLPMENAAFLHEKFLFPKANGGA